VKSTVVLSLERHKKQNKNKTKTKQKQNKNKQTKKNRGKKTYQQPAKQTNKKLYFTCSQVVRCKHF